MNEEQHPWYGPCDEFGPGGACTECARERFRHHKTWVQWLRSDCPGPLTPEAVEQVARETLGWAVYRLRSEYADSAGFWLRRQTDNIVARVVAAFPEERANG